MPRIPQFQSSATQGTPGISPDVFAAPARAMAQVGEGLAQIGGRAAQEAEEEAKAERTLKALAIEGGVNEESITFAEGLKERTDYEKFEEDSRNHLNGLRSKYLPMAGDDRVLQAAFERKYNSAVGAISRAAKVAKRDVMSKQALGRYEGQKNTMLQEYAASDDPTHREMILADFEIATLTMVDSKYLDPAQAEKDILAFSNAAEGLRVDQDRERDPFATEKKLRAGEYKLTPDRAQKEIEAVKVAQRQSIEQEERAERLAERKEKKAQEDRAVEWEVQFGETGKVNLSRLRDDLRDHKISRQFYDSFVDDVRSGKESSDSLEVLRIEEGIKDGTVSRTEILNNRALSIKDKRMLRDKFDTFQDKRTKEAYERGEDQLKAQIITTSPFMPPAEGEAERFAIAKMELFERIKSGENLDAVLKDMIPRYDQRPTKLRTLATPRFSHRPTSVQDVSAAKKELLGKISSGTIDINTEAGQQAAQREIELLTIYQKLLEQKQPTATGSP